MSSASIDEPNELALFVDNGNESVAAVVYDRDLVNYG
jgi:hypothetical protein